MHHTSLALDGNSLIRIHCKKLYYVRLYYVYVVYTMWNRIGILWLPNKVSMVASAIVAVVIETLRVQLETVYIFNNTT